MSYTIFTSNPTALIPQPGRAVNTFPSGLVRVDQTYLGLTSESATHRTTLAIGNDMPDGDSSPCIDGLKIFPEVQERRREDGFTEYLVSAYGRSNTTGKKTIEQDLGTVAADYRVLNYITQNGSSEISEINNYRSRLACTTDRLLWLFCVPKNSQVSIAPTDLPNVYAYDGNKIISRNLLEILSEFEPTLLPGYYYGSGDPSILPQDIVRQLETSFTVEGIQKTNFGSFDEWTITYAQKNPVINFTSGYWHPARRPLGATIANLLGTNINDMLTRTLGPVWNVSCNALRDNLVQLTDTFQPIATGRAKIETISSITKVLNNQFGYWQPGVTGESEFIPFQRPAGGVYRQGVGSMPGHVIQGVAEWAPSFTWHNDSLGDYANYVYNLLGGSIGACFSWSVSNEFGQTSTFDQNAVFQPEVLDAP